MDSRPEPALDLYRRVHLEPDQVERINSCYKGGPDFISEVYSADAGSGFGYDGLGQVLGANGTTFDSNGGPMRQRRFTYDSRGNLSDVKVDQYGNGYAFQFDGGTATRRDWLTRVQGGDSFNVANLSYDRDGRVYKIAGGVDSSGYAPALLLGYDSDNPALVGPGSDTVMSTSTRSTASGSSPTWTYWYDSSNRRQAKVYPLNNISDVFLYDLGHQLLEDKGNETTSAGGPYPMDEYIWLGGSPIAVYRSKLSSSLVHSTDDTGTCSRLGDGVACGVYFVVTDHIGKPVLTLNGERKISGAGEYEPYGGMNRVQWWWATSHPYTKGPESPSFLTFSQKELGMEVGFRAHFPLVDTEQDCYGTVREGPSIWDAPWGTMYEVLGGYNKGELWSQWQTPGDVGTDWRSMAVGWGTLAGNCYATNCGAACPQASGSGQSYSGFTLREYEYRRFESGATPYFPPLRFPGQYHDPETDLYENWHRYYFPAGGRYLSPEPLLQNPLYVRRMAQGGMSVPTYAYAANNPLRYVDRNGLDPGVPYPNLSAAAADARDYVYRTHSPDALLHEWGGTFYRRPDGRVEYSQPTTLGQPNMCGMGWAKTPPTGLIPIGGFHNHPRSSRPPWGGNDLTDLRFQRDNASQIYSQDYFDLLIFTPSDLAFQYTASPGPISLTESYFVPGWQPW